MSFLDRFCCFFGFHWWTSTIFMIESDKDGRTCMYCGKMQIWGKDYD